MITLSKVSKSYDNGRSFVVNNVSFEVHTGETLVLLGSSGSGKTTTLKMINRLVKPTSGKINFDGKDVTQYPLTELRRNIGYVFQQVGLFPHMTIENNLSIVLKLMHVNKQKCKQRAAELLELVGLDPQIFATRYPDELSGGQEQRVGVARALAANPKWFIHQ